MTDIMWKGVWLADEPLDCGAGAKGFTVLSVKIPIDNIRRYEWVEEGKLYREFLVPAALVNSYRPFTIEDDDWKDCTEKQILERCESLRQHDKKRAAELKRHLLFLKRHHLLIGDD